MQRNADCTMPIMLLVTLSVSAFHFNYKKTTWLVTTTSSNARDCYCSVLATTLFIQAYLTSYCKQ